MNTTSNKSLYRSLIFQFIKRDISAKYKGSQLGFLWSVLNPLLMLAVYTFVFSEIFQARWSSASSNKMEFAMIIFTGILTYNIMSEVLVRSPGIILSNSNYVKKVVFPLEIFSVVLIGSALIQNLIGFVILIVSLAAFLGVINITLLFIPIVLFPLVLITLGLGWMLSALGVYLRDISQVVGVAVQALMLLSPIFYPIESVPDDLKLIYSLNPVGYVVEDMRRIIIWGEMPNWQWILIGSIVGLIISLTGYYLFRKSKKGFADVI